MCPKVASGSNVRHHRRVLNIGIIGAGAIVRERHMPGLAAIPDVQVRAVANASLASAEAFCGEFAPQADRMDDWERLVVREDLDIVWIGTGPFLHAPASVAALESGKHVFCQARMSTDLAGARRMLAAAEARPGLLAMLCPPPHGLRIDAFAREIFGSIGEIRSVRLQSLNAAFLDPEQPAHWRQRTEISGKNILTLGIFTEVLHRWIGRFRVQTARGELRTPVRRGYHISIPDSLTVLAEFEGGAEGLLEFSGIHPGMPVETLEVCGSRGVLRFNFQNDAVELAAGPDSGFRQLDIPKNLLRPWQVESDFIQAVKMPAGVRPHPDFHDGFAYMTVVEEVWDRLTASA